MKFFLASLFIIPLLARADGDVHPPIVGPIDTFNRVTFALADEDQAITFEVHPVGTFRVPCNTSWISVGQAQIIDRPKNTTYMLYLNLEEGDVTPNCSQLKEMSLRPAPVTPWIPLSASSGHVSFVMQQPMNLEFQKVKVVQ